MEETKSAKQYSDKLMKLMNKIRILEEDLPQEKIVEKIILSLPKKFESKISLSREFYTHYKDVTYKTYECY
jgi:preprotein translocase subunit SecA